MTDAEIPTIADVFRVVNDMRNELGSRLDRVANGLDSLRGEVRSKYSELGQQIDASNVKIGMLERRMVAMQTEIGGLSSNIAGASEQIANVGTALDGHTAQFRDVKDKLDTLSDRMDRAGVPA